MSTTQSQDRPQLAPAIGKALTALRRRIRRYVVCEGTALAAAWLGVAFWGTLAVDWFFEPPVAARAVMLAVVAAILAGIVWRQIVCRVFVRLTDRNMATVLERRFRQFDDSLLTAVALSGRPTTTSTFAKGTVPFSSDENWDSPQLVFGRPLSSPEPGDAEFNAQMLEQTTSTAAAHLGSLRLGEVFNPLPLWRAVTAAGLSMSSVLLLALITPGSLSVWARRNLAFSDVLWPRSTRLLVDGFPAGAQKVARGADLEVIARADLSMPRVPQLVEVRYRTEGGARGRAAMDRRGVARRSVDRFQEYAYTFHGLLADVHFDVVGGDDRVSNLWIQVVDSPKISEMTLECVFPAYIGRLPESLPVTGVMQVPMGTRITVHAAVNKDLLGVHADSLLEDRPGPTSELPSDAISADRRGFRYPLGPLMKDTTLLFTLTDSDHIRSRDPVRLALVPIADQPPRLAVQLDGIGSAITPQARLPAAGHIADDYGVDRAWFEQAVDQQKPSSHAIAIPAGAATDISLTGAALEVRGLALKPGQKMLVCVKAADRCDLGKGPNVGTSERWLLDVVSPEQLRAMLEARELVLRQQCEQIVQETTETRDLLARLAFDAPAQAAKASREPAKPAKDAANPGSASVEQPTDSPEQPNRLRLLRVQGALADSRKTTQEVAGVADAIDEIRKQLVNNRIDTEELKQRLQAGIADPLRALVEQSFPELDRRLEKLQAAVADLQAGPRRRDQARQQADDIILAMRKVLDRMIAMEDFNQAVELLRTIIQEQEKLRAETQQRHKQKVREFLKE